MTCPLTDRGIFMNTLDKKTIAAAYQLIDSAERILIVAHQKPDGDTSGSSLALRLWLHSLQKEAEVFCITPLSDQFLYMPGADTVKNDPEIFQQHWDLMIVCDSGDLKYAGVDKLVKQLPKKPKILNFDHHRSNVLFGDTNLVDIAASSTAEVVYRFLTEVGVDISKEMSICLLTAIFTDTGGFSNAATNKEALEMASVFVKKGASISDIHRATVRNKQIEVMKLWGKVMSRLNRSKYGIAYTYILKEDLQDSNLSDEAIDGLSNYLSHIKDAKAVFVLSEREGGIIKVSMRTYRDDIDLAQLAFALGGGGHKKAAGFTFSGRLSVALEKVKVIPA